MKNLVRQYARQISHTTLTPLSDWVLEQSIAIQQIPAPTFAEEARAAYLLQQFEALGLEQTHTDSLYNVYGLLRGENDTLPGIMMMAHSDTVFPIETDLTLRYEANTVHGPGLGDNSVGVGGLLGVAKYLQDHQSRPACNIWFVVSSREEGLGNLDGARLAFETLQAQIQQVINVEGLAYGYVYNAGIAVRRLHITAKASGGHSWLHFGRESAVHAIMQLGAAITQINPPQSPRTTYNIGIVNGGHSINSIATHAELWLDLRSEQLPALQNLEAIVRDTVQRLQKKDVQFEIKVVGDRPAGEMATNHPLILGALAALEETGIRGVLQIGSTDGNIPLSHNMPTVTVGITRGGNAHRLDEYIELAPIKKGLRQLLILTLATAQYQAEALTTP